MHLAFADIVDSDTKKRIELTDAKRRGIVAALLKVAKDADLVTFLPIAQKADAAVALLGEGELIPNSTGFAGSVPIAKERWLSLGILLRQIIGTLDAVQTVDPMLLSDLVGVNVE